MYFTVVALVLLFLSAFKMEAQVGLSELDPNILWVADSTIGQIDGFAVHPNGNVFVYKGSTIYEIDGTNGKLIKMLPVTIDAVELSSIDISSDGSKLAVSWNKVVIIDLSNYHQTLIPNAARVGFLPNQNKIGFTTGVQGQTGGHDSSIVILDLNTGVRQKIKTEELIQKIAFSPDGRFLATGGSGQNVFGKSYTSLKLWDANTLKLIKELERMDETNYGFERIEFSNNSKLVGFIPKNGEVFIYNSENSTLFRKFNQNVYPFKRFGRFCFIKDSLIAFTSITGPGTFLLNLYEEEVYVVSDYLAQSGLNYNSKQDAIILGTSTQLIAFDLKRVISSISEDANQTRIQASYQKGTLSISGLQETSNMVNLEIFDINGKLICKIGLQPIGSEIRVPLVLTNGTYLINIQDGSNLQTGKFVVVE
jgi:WD40 repeat protein